MLMKSNQKIDMSYFYQQFKENKTFKLITILFVLLVIWWITIYTRGLTEGVENDAFTLAYPILTLIGGMAGWMYSKKWGGFKSTLGSAIAFFSLGLLAQFLGQVLYSYYIFIVGVEVPYPSVGDISFFASVIFYIIATFKLAKVSGIQLTFTSIRGKLQAFIIPLAVLILSYVLLLKGYEPDFTNKVILFLDFGFPIGQVIYVSVAVLALLISKEILGGIMRKPIMLLIFALIFQYIADFAFSYQFAHGTVYTGDVLDLLYTVSYFLMAVSLVSIGNMFYKVQES